MYFYAVAVGGFSACAAALVAIPESPLASGRQPGTVATAPSARSSSVPSSPSTGSGPATVGSSPGPGGIELVGATVPTVGLPPTRSSGPASTPSATATGSTGVPSPSPSPSSSGSSGQQGVTLDVQLTPTPLVSVGVGVGGLDVALGL